MGASGSSSAAEDMPQSMDQLLGVLRSGAIDVRNVGALSWPEFLALVSALNKKCKDQVDNRGKHLLFALKKGSSDSILWKATVRVCCLQMSSTTVQVETRRIFNLAQFLRAARTVTAMLEQHQQNHQSITNHTEEESCSVNEQPNNPNHNLMTTSVLMHELVQLSSAADAGTADTDLNAECILCLERRPDTILPCAHCYCRPCIDQWKETARGHKCPVCRAQSERDGADDWVVISDKPQSAEVSNYLLSMARE